MSLTPGTSVVGNAGLRIVLIKCLLFSPMPFIHSFILCLVLLNSLVIVSMLMFFFFYNVCINIFQCELNKRNSLPEIFIVPML